MKYIQQKETAVSESNKEPLKLQTLIPPQNSVHLSLRERERKSTEVNVKIMQGISRVDYKAVLVDLAKEKTQLSD